MFQVEVKKNFDFIVNKWLGDSRMWRTDVNCRGQPFTMVFPWTICDSSSNCFSWWYKAVNIFLTVRICLSYTPLIWLAWGLCNLNIIHSQFSCRISPLISHGPFLASSGESSFLAPIKFVCWSDLRWTGSHLSIHWISLQCICYF